jgi:hypothetical protein
MGCANSRPQEYSALELLNQICEKICDSSIPDVYVLNFIIDNLQVVYTICESMKIIEHVIYSQLTFARDLIDYRRPAIKTAVLIVLMEQCLMVVQSKLKKSRVNPSNEVQLATVSQIDDNDIEAGVTEESYSYSYSSTMRCD